MSILKTGFLEAQASGQQFFSLEFFPPKTPQGMLNMRDRLGRIASWKPLFCSVTWGSGGSTFNQSMEFASMLKTEFGIEPLLHLTCSNMPLKQIDYALRVAKSKGIFNILALRGDEPVSVSNSEYPTATDSIAETRFSHASELVEYIRANSEFESVFTIGVAGHPEGYKNSSSSSININTENEHATTLAGSRDIGKDEGDNEGRDGCVEDGIDIKEIRMLASKINKGADFVLSQIFYSSDKFIKWYAKCREYGIAVPIIPTLLPIQTYSSFQRIVKLTGVHVPHRLTEQLDGVKHDDQKVKDIGVDHCVSQVEELQRSTDIIGIHFSTLNLEMSVNKMLRLSRFLRRAGDGEKRVDLVDSVEGSVFQSQLQPQNPLQGGQAGFEAAGWDEFPNGRFGDARSPAFFNDSLYGQPGNISNSLDEFGFPSSDADLNLLFKQYVVGQVGALPWTSESIGISNSAHLEKLEALCSKGMWTLASQLAVDGADSNDKEFGWGPSDGYVYQRSFVECFMRDSIFQKLQAHLKTHKKEITFYAAKLECTTNKNIGTKIGFSGTAGAGEDTRIRLVTSNLDKEEVIDCESENGVLDTNTHTYLGSDSSIDNSAGDNDDSVVESTVLTWGVFPGTTVIQPALIDKLNFSYWSKEAISMWSVWSQLAALKNQTSSEFISKLTSNVWLVNIVGNDYKKPLQLFEIIELLNKGSN